MPSEDSGALLRTKLYRPPVPRDFVERPRLNLEQLTGHPFTLVSAAAGYGKSVLVSSWLDSWPGPSAWISLDESDNDLRVFLQYVCAATEQHFPSVLLELSEQLTAPVLPPRHELAKLLINGLDEIEAPFVLVFDDIHAIREPAVLDVLATVLEHPPALLRLVLVGRRDPFLPIARLRAQSRLAEVRSADLSFTFEETEAFLESALDVDVSEPIARSWRDRTEGWATGLRLATIALQGESEIAEEPFKRRKPVRDVMAYLLAEVVESQPRDVRQQLYHSALVDRFCASLCEALSARPEPLQNVPSGEAFLSWLEARGLFVIPLDDSRGWFRFHPLFREMLSERANLDLGAEQITIVHLRASVWFEDAGLIDEALRHALEAGDHERAADIVERHRHPALDEDRWHEVERWLARIPHTQLLQRAELTMAKAWCEYSRFRVQSVPDLVETATRVAGSATARPHLHGEIGFFRGVLELWAGQPETSERTLERALEALRGGPAYIEGDSQLHLAVARSVAGRPDKAIAELERQSHAAPPSGKGEALRRGGRTLVHLIVGNLPAASAAAEEFAEISARRGLDNMGGWAAYFRGWADLHACELGPAARHFGRAVELRYALETRAASDALAGLALTQQLMGERELAVKTAELLGAHVREQSDDPVVARSCHARLSILAGDPAPALEWARLPCKEPDLDELFTWLEVPLITGARVLIAAGDEADVQTAIERLEECRVKSDQWNLRGQGVELGVLQTLAMLRLGQRQEASESLERAVTLAEGGGWIRPFVEAGSEMQALLRSLEPKAAGRPFVARIWATWDRGVAPRAEPSDASIPAKADPLRQHRTSAELTSRELDVLELLAERLQDKEIAARLYITTHTVNHHLKRIYRKLGVSGRRQAVRRATELGILGGQPQA
jgi:LuxR family maltose regulon positive regulatory protein